MGNLCVRVRLHQIANVSWLRSSPLAELSPTLSPAPTQADLQGGCSNPKPLRQHLSQRQAELMVRNQQAVEHVPGQSPAIVPGGRADRCPESSACHVHVSALTYCTTMTTCPSGLFVTVYQMVKPS